MRWLLLALLILSGLALAPPAQTLPRGTERFRLGWAAFQMDSALRAREVETLSRGHDFLTTMGEEPSVEYVQYSLTTSPLGPSFVWKVTVAYRVPYTRAEFDSLSEVLIAGLGTPAQRQTPDFSAGLTEEKLTWVDALTSVQLGARWNVPQDPRADRMIVTWTDRRLQKVVEVQRRKPAR
jgi:hypothetical protein